MRARSDVERRLWRAAIAVVVALYASAYFVQFAVDHLFKRNLLRVTIAGFFALTAAALVVWLVRKKAGWRAFGTALLAGGAYGVAAQALHVVQERIHLLESGALVLLLRAALMERAAADPGFGFRGKVAASCGAFALAFLAGAGDEALQGLLPNRHADLRDLGLNAGAAAMALLTAGATERALERDHRAAEGPR